MAFIDYAGETEEERRRRLEQEAAAAAMSDEATASGGAAPGAFDSFFNNRLAAAQDRMAQEAADTEVQSQTVKTYGDGSQEQIVKTQRPAPQAEVTGPAVPPPVMPQQAAPVQQQAPAAVAPAVPGQESRPQVFPAFAAAVQQNQARPAQPAIPPEMATQAVAMPPMPQPGPPVQVASTDPAAGLQAAAAARAQQQAQQVAAQAPAVTPSLQQQAQTFGRGEGGGTVNDIHQQSVVSAHNEKDPSRRRNAFAQLIADPEVSEGNKALANKFMAEEYLHQRNIEKANKEIEEKSPTELSRYLKESKKEGSYIKAILLARLGLTDLAAKEQELINPTRTADTAVVGDKKYAVIKRKDGSVEAAFDINGKRAGQEAVAQIMAAAMPTKSFLLPSSIGGTMQKTIIGPDGKEQVITGAVIRDPQTDTLYFQAGNKRYDTTGLSTPAQNVQNVYSAEGAKQQATQAAQTGQPQGALPPLTMGGQTAPAATAPAATTTVAGATPDPAAARRAQTDIESLTNELTSSKYKLPDSKREADRVRYLNDEMAKAQQRLQAASGGIPVPTGAGGQLPTENFLQYQERLKREGALSQAAATANIDISKAERLQFKEKVLPEINKKGDDGRFVADTRRTQVSMLTGPNSAIMGIYRGSGKDYDKARAVLRDAITGTFSGQEGGERFSEAVRGISINETELSALKEFAQLNTDINAKTLAENAGEGPKSDADIKLNQQANMTNIGDLPAFAALSGLTRSQFAGDVNKRKQDFVLANEDKYQTQSQVEKAWSKEKDTLNRQYEGIYRERLNFIDAKMVEKFGKDWRKRPNDETQGFYRDASIHSFNVLPTPNYDVQTQKFVYPTQQSKLAAMRAITGR